MTTDSTGRTNGPARFAKGADGTHHAADRLVAHTKDVPFIIGLLPQGAAEPIDKIDELGISLLRFADVQATVAELRPAFSGSADPLERVMAWLRARSREQHQAEPEMGKDRVVLAGEGLPIISPKVIPSAAYGPFAARGDRPQPGVDPKPDGSGVVVGVLDTAVIASVVRDPDYEDIVTFSSNSETTPDAVKEAWQGHGTFVTALIRAQAPRAEIRVRAILPGDGFATAWEAARGMAELQAAGAQVINMSIGCVTGDHQPPFALRAAVDGLQDKVLLVAAAGNYDPDAGSWPPPTWPAALEAVLAVGSISGQGSYSAFSPDEPWVDLVAVGENVTSAFKDGDVLCLLPGGATRTRRFWGTATWSGTSFAAATVSGRLATRASASGSKDWQGLAAEAQGLMTGELWDDVVRQP
jgi:membrane-anchored mycosin MYCP